MSNYNTQLQSNNTDLQTVLQTLQTKAAGGTQATPVISVSSNGLITATAGTKTSTHQLAFQAAKTITPSTASQIAVSSGYYTGGNITVAGDSNLVAGNIKSGVSIFGVNGTLVEGGSSSGEQVEWSANEDAIVSGELSGSYFNDRVTKITNHAFNNQRYLTTVNFPMCISIFANAFLQCTRLASVSFPNCVEISPSAFYGCNSLEIVNFPKCEVINISCFGYCNDLTTAIFPKCTEIWSSAFTGCSNLVTISFPLCSRIRTSAFYGCTNLATVSFPKGNSIAGYAFNNCYNLKSLYLMGSSVCELKNSNAFTSTPIGGYSASAKTYGSIYVPASLLTSYKTATNWTYFSSRFVGI